MKIPAPLSALAMQAGAVALVLALTLAPANANNARQGERAHRVSELLIKNGLASLDKSKFDEARQAFEQAVVSDPGNAKAFSYLGYAHYRQGNTDLAKKYFSIALEIDPDEPQALNWGGQADLASADLESAEAKLLRLSRVCSVGCSELKLLSDAVSTYKTKAN